MAIKELFLLVHRRGVVMAFADVFALLCLLYAAFALLTVLMRRPDPGAAAH